MLLLMSKNFKSYNKACNSQVAQLLAHFPQSQRIVNIKIINTFYCEMVSEDAVVTKSRIDTILLSMVSSGLLGLGSSWLIFMDIIDE